MSGVGQKVLTAVSAAGRRSPELLGGKVKRIKSQHIRKTEPAQLRLRAAPSWEVILHMLAFFSQSQWWLLEDAGSVTAAQRLSFHFQYLNHACFQMRVWFSAYKALN